MPIRSKHYRLIKPMDKDLERGSIDYLFEMFDDEDVDVFSKEKMY